VAYSNYTLPKNLFFLFDTLNLRPFKAALFRFSQCCFTLPTTILQVNSCHKYTMTSHEIVIQNLLINQEATTDTACNQLSKCPASGRGIGKTHRGVGDYREAHNSGSRNSTAQERKRTDADNEDHAGVGTIQNRITTVLELVHAPRGERLPKLPQRALLNLTNAAGRNPKLSANTSVRPQRVIVCVH
jgi:hypothetical protein